MRGSSNAFTANDFPRRAALADKRARLVRRVVDGQNFYRWQPELTHRLTEKLVLHVLPLFRQGMIPQAKSDLYRAVNEAVKITVRMRKEATRSFLGLAFGCCRRSGARLQTDHGRGVSLIIPT